MGKKVRRFWLIWKDTLRGTSIEANAPERVSPARKISVIRTFSTDTEKKKFKNERETLRKHGEESGQMTGQVEEFKNALSGNLFSLECDCLGRRKKGEGREERRS